jgi:hypothetical protein
MRGTSLVRYWMPEGSLGIFFIKFQGVGDDGHDACNLLVAKAVKPVIESGADRAYAG